jgi:hypothetical protein
VSEQAILNALTSGYANASDEPGVTLAAYQESRIRHLHRTLDRDLAER